MIGNKTIVFLGTNKAGSSRDAIKAAQDLGYFTCLFTNRSDQIKQRRDYHDVHLMRYVDLNDKEEIKKQIEKLKYRALKVVAIVSFVDPWCEIAAILAKEYGFKSFTVNAISTSLSKIATHEILKKTSYPPKYNILSDINIEDYYKLLPLVVKACNSYGSKDVYLCNNKKDFNESINKLQKKYSDDKIIIEEYLDGPQYLVETFIMNEEVNIVAIIHQEIENIDNHFIITGYQLILDTDTSLFQNLKDDVKNILHKLGFINGSCHLEMRYVKGKWRLVEVNPRISGSGMNRIIRIGLGIDLAKEILKYSLKNEVNLTPKHKIHTYAKYKGVSKPGTLLRVTGKERALNSQGVKYVYIKPRKGAYLIPPISLGSRYAYVIATDKNAARAKYNAIRALDNITFHLDNNKRPNSS